MGSVSDLKFKSYTIAGTKNYLDDYRFLFQEEDRKREEEEDDGDYHYFYSRKLFLVKDRLELNGYNLINAERVLKEINSKLDSVTFIRILSVVDFSLDSYQIQWDGNFDNELMALIYNSPEAKKIIEDIGIDDEELSDIDYSLNDVNPFLILRCISEIDDYRNDEVIWDYHDLFNGGWIDKKDIRWDSIDPIFLILTEGKSDTSIIRSAINKLRPDVSDLVYFADMENHPFGGTGNIVKFVKGLIDIKYKGNTIVILDNDLAGNEALSSIKEFQIPKNIEVLTLPEHKDFNEFKTLGTSGSYVDMNVNGSAVSIESFLDLSSISADPFIRWVQWNVEKEKYQGRFDKTVKTQLQKKFDRAVIKDNSEEYDFTKLHFLVDCIFKVAKKLAGEASKGYGTILR